MIERHKHPQLLQTLQLIVLIIGVGGVFLTIGAKNEILAHHSGDLIELKEIVQELVRSQVTLVTADVRHQTVLEEIKTRLETLERKLD